MLRSLAIAAVTSMLAGLSGCADNQESLIVLHAPLWEDDGACAVTDSEEALLQGLLDVGFGTPYVMPALLMNNSTAQNPQTNNSGTDTNEIQLLDADVKLVFPQAPEIHDALKAMNSALVDFNVRLSANSIPPGATSGVLVEVIPQQTSAALATEIVSRFGPSARVTAVAEVTFHGSRSGNEIGKVGGIDAREFTFPITLCSGCLVSCVDCPMAQCPVGTSSYVGGVCGNAQDIPLKPAACADE